MLPRNAHRQCQPSAEWTTRLENTGDLEIHTAWFVPPGWCGHGANTSLGLPECELIFSKPGPDGRTISFVDRPQKNKNAKYWLKFACKAVGRGRTPLFVNCDTPAQLDAAVALAAKHLPGDY